MLKENQQPVGATRQSGVRLSLFGKWLLIAALFSLAVWGVIALAALSR